MFEKICQGCGCEYEAKTKRSRFCPICFKERQLEKQRQYQKKLLLDHAKAAQNKIEKPKQDVCDSFCDNCIYRGKAGSLRCCNRYLATDIRKNGGFGKNCKDKVTPAMVKAKKKAIEKKPKAPKPAPAFGRITVCPICQIEFQANKQQRKYCSPECTHVARLETYKQQHKKRKEKANGQCVSRAAEG